MQLDQNPFFRKTITPWYDSNFACWALIWSMVLVFCFAVDGVIVAANDPRLAHHIWFPLLLAGLSSFLAVKVYVRLNIRVNNE
ncbi:hypothetical protein DO021_10385 [Desulfobacter hydrogenophilus]|uniref:DUF4281 domain-containing protein n=1 Tax=Desulfobacter hydrogenophilus TaxID=2291 RepID=A0A328FE38_9BACT|nr:hypothetical protein [Desulfobacter hydrogenophilus]NDY71931.1 hypothetical protein [Desulfobacter hydrogenophilus]QBH12377.1 hypothetical protein EYB58_05300 [Desulfobacter hydrogenophilus]RAM02020.1 hypothetical protein DO021_10385 [Desulfobacter hydrogenophilus]